MNGKETTTKQMGNKKKMDHNMHRQLMVEM
jgi:hypothetical protein